ncbi:MAG TPA: YigZ family protein, partial [Chitinophagales bacterium]|nr:YigZ family protein [Chitinophagales bacterium]
MRFKTIDAPSHGEYKEKGSRFVACAFPVSDSTAVKQILGELKREYPKARHHCFAYRIGFDGTQHRANDDGEPSGTAGKPILGQIDSFGLTNTIVVVVRYFGGVLLGASGLNHAYKTA